MDIYVVHYGEIGLKGKNRDYFEEALIRNMNLALKGRDGKRIRKRYGRILIEDGNAETDQVLKFIPGIKYFAPAKKTGPHIDMIKAAALEVAQAENGRSSFKIETRRTDKTFPMNSIEVNRAVGEHLVQQTGRDVSLQEPDLTVYIEICDNEAYIYKDKIYGVGGLPVGTAGQVVSLLSGGIDSPVAAFMMMKRGCEVVPIHFFNQTIHSQGVRGKIDQLGEALTRIQTSIKLYMVPFGELQREIVQFIPARYRMLVYRRTMMRMASKIADAEGAKAIVTGDSLSQVASQTLDNLGTIYGAASHPVLPPLLGMDKEETINLAREIGTYKISILPYPDCCTYMVARHPETRGRIELLEELERNLVLDVEGTVEDAEVKIFSS